MFYQNSNDLVKNASVKSGHLQNSKETQERMNSEVNILKDNDNHYNTSNNNTHDNSSLNIGMQFQQMIQGLMNGFSIKEGMNAGAGAVTPADPST